LEQAVTLLATAILQEKKIVVIGDFDVDGATSTALCVLVLNSMGARVDYLVPDRFRYGYGLSPEIVQLAYEQKQPDLLLTVDNGIASLEGVALAKKLQMQVLITDHHLAGQVLPEADAIVNPNQPGCEFPSKNLAGVGVAFYLLSRLKTVLKEKNYFVEQQKTETNLADYLDLVALGTVADVVSLDHNNRILVQQGLLRIRARKCRPGIVALLAVKNIAIETVVASDLAFYVAPRLNAAGRLDDMSHGIECLLTPSESVAAQYASELDGINQDRIAIEFTMQNEAMQALQQCSFSSENLPLGLVMYHPAWHQGVSGILASRLKEKFHRPTIVFAPNQDDNGHFSELKGSARSLNGIHIRDVLDEVATKNPGLITRFGGHAMAAGLSLPKDNLALFKAAFNQALEKYAHSDVFEPVLWTDGELAPEYFKQSFVEKIKFLLPWGQHCPEPLFVGEFICLEQRILKEKYLKLAVSHPNSNSVFDVMVFQIDVREWPNPAIKRVRLAYKVVLNTFRGVTKVELVADYIEAIREN
jgi:single-stranded-DNA-specific exonuclease